VKSRCKRNLETIFAGLLLAWPLSAQVAGTSTPRQPSLFTWRDGLLAGGFVIGAIAIRPLDKRAATDLQAPSYQKNQFLKKSATIVRNIAQPGAFIIGPSMYAAGRIGKDKDLAELGLYGTEALFVGLGVGSVLKDSFGRARPFVDTVGPNPNDYQFLRGFHAGDNYRSFPSGHTMSAFAAAAAVSAETSRWYPRAIYVIGPLMYGGAAAVGVSRMYDNRHWASDVIVGAAIGTFAGIKVVRYQRLHPGNRLDRWLLNASASPSDLRHISLSVLPMFR
jgi:membrane-associated phospholipid phosphatase